MNYRKNLAIAGADQHAFRLRCITLSLESVCLPVPSIVYLPVSKGERQAPPVSNCSQQSKQRETGGAPQGSP